MSSDVLEQPKEISEILDGLDQPKADNAGQVSTVPDTAPQGKYRNRIKDLRYIDPKLIDPAPANWRTHPTEQRIALENLLREVGIAQALVVREKANGRFELVDGHLRSETITEQPLPVLVIDISDKEANALVAAMDAIGELRGRDDLVFQKMMDEMAENGNYEDLLRQIDVDPRTTLEGLDKIITRPEDKVEFPITPTFDEGYDSVIIFCRTTGEFAELQNILGLEKKVKADSKSRIGVARVMDCPEFLSKWRARNG